MLCVHQQLASTVQYLERCLLLFVTSASDLALCAIKCCSVVFSIVVQAACDKQDSLMHGGLQMDTTLSANKNLAIANRLNVNCAQNTLRASIGINITS